MIEIIEKSACCGCTACASICPRSCIKMIKDEEGFLYPSVQKQECINCGLCDSVCPIKQKKQEDIFEQKGFLIRHKDLQIRIDSTSGGAFTAFAEAIIDREGYVYGAILDENLKVKHIGINTKDDIKKFRNSKYVQSEINNCFSEIESLLKQDKIVCFSGTPCQVEGLARFLRKDYENLYLIDTVCRAVPSPLIFEKYKELQTKKNGKIRSIRFRDKFYSYAYSTLNLDFEKKEYHRGVESDPWLRAFFSEICDRPCCHTCVFRNRYRKSDITMWDCFNVREFNSDWDDGSGVTRVLVHSAKGTTLLKKANKYAELQEIDPNKLISKVQEMVSSPKENRLRTQFMSDAKLLDGEKLFEKYFPIKIKHKIKHFLRIFLVKTGFYNRIKYKIRELKKR